MKRYPYQLMIKADKSFNVKGTLHKLARTLNLEGIEANASTTGQGRATHWLIQLPITKFMKERLEKVNTKGFDFIVKNVDTDEVVIASHAKWRGKSVREDKVEDEIGIKRIKEEVTN